MTEDEKNECDTFLRGTDFEVTRIKTAPIPLFAKELLEKAFSEATDMAIAKLKGVQ